MSAKYESIINRLTHAVKSAGAHETSPYDSDATVTRVDGDTAWVHLAGGIDETPVKKTIDCKAGDTVQVRVGGGTAFLVGNQTAPPTDDTTAVKGINSVSKTVKKVKAIADKASRIAGNTAQYFWHTQDGTDTGVHITEVPQATFEANPTGGNLLARSNGIAVRDGLTELATFGSDGIALYNDNGNETFKARSGSGRIRYSADLRVLFGDTFKGTFVYGREISDWGDVTIEYAIGSTTSVDYYTRSHAISFVDNVFQVTEDEYTLTLEDNGSSVSYTVTASQAVSFVTKISFAPLTDTDASEVCVGIFPDETNSAPFIVGIGTSDEDRRNALAVGWDGSIMVETDAYVYRGDTGGHSVSEWVDLTDTTERIAIDSGNNQAVLNIKSQGCLALRFVSVTVSVESAYTWAAGANLVSYELVGTLPPPNEMPVLCGSYFGSHAISARLEKDGNYAKITIRNASDTAINLTANSRIALSFLYPNAQGVLASEGRV